MSDAPEQSPPEQSPPPAAPARLPLPPFRRPRKENLRRALIFLAVGLFVGSGFFHCAYGGGIERVRLCPKESWGIRDTFVNLDDIVGRSPLELGNLGAVVRALEVCDVIDTTRMPGQ
jgi:hypothetical protein